MIIQLAFCFPLIHHWTVRHCHRYAENEKNQTLSEACILESNENFALSKQTLTACRPRENPRGSSNPKQHFGKILSSLPTTAFGNRDWELYSVNLWVYQSIYHPSKFAFQGAKLAGFEE